MSTPVRDEMPATLEGQRPPDWSPVVEPPTGGGGRRLGGVALRGAVAGALAVLLWAAGRPLAAAVLVAVIVPLTAASLRFPAVAGVAERAERAVQRAAGRALALVLLSAVQLLVFTPVSLLLRLVRHDPLALGSSPDDASFWRPTPRAPRALYRRPFAYERALTPRRRLAGGPLPRLRAALGLVALVALIDVGLGAAIDGVRDLATASAPARRQSLLLRPDAAAGRHEPWRKALGDEVTSAWEHKRYDPFLGWRVPEFDGRYVNVANGVRRSYEPRGSDAPDAVKVFFFGGSTMFGSFQRDEHTIPSEVARLAQRDGIRLRVVNYGQLAYLNWQEVLQLEELLIAGSKPDLAVFYDGFNELLSQFSLGPHREPTHLEAREIEDRLRLGRKKDEPSLPTALYRAWADKSVLHGLARSLGVLHPAREPTAPMRPAWTGDQRHRPGQRAVDATYVYSRGVDIARRLADRHRFRSAFVWQPSIYSKRLLRGEEPLLTTLGADPGAWRMADRTARSRLKPPVIDLGSALDGVSEPVMYDFVHTNELGAKAIARALYRRLRPVLVALSRERRR